MEKETGINFASKQELAEFLRAEIDQSIKGAGAQKSKDELRAEMEMFGDVFAKFVNKPIPTKGLHKFKTEGMQDAVTASHVKNFIMGQILPQCAQTNEVMVKHAEAVKAMSIGTLADGGYLAPSAFREEVMYLYADYSKFRKTVQEIPMDGAKLDWPVVTGGPTMYWPGENTAITDSKPALALIPLVASLGGALVYLPRQLVASSRIDVMGLLTLLMAECFSAGEIAVFTNGTGSAQPKGFRHTDYSTIPSVAQAGANLVANDMLALQYKVAEKYRRNGVYQFTSTIEALLMKLVDSTTTRPIWTPSIQDGTPATIYGKPYIINDQIPVNLGTGTNESEVWFGSWKQGYVVGDMEQMGVESSTQAGATFAAHQLAVKAVEFVDGRVGIPTAIAKLTAVK